mmetsp:Transcript_54751/g.166359  ORF Transcript_54751/g.166359 Transcript_54751/m.166359 type:complete len:259 (-) Transcript_54751:855-1631(-)
MQGILEGHRFRDAVHDADDIAGVPHREPRTEAKEARLAAGERGGAEVGEGVQGFEGFEGQQRREAAGVHGDPADARPRRQEWVPLPVPGGVVRAGPGLRGLRVPGVRRERPEGHDGFQGGALGKFRRAAAAAFGSDAVLPLHVGEGHADPAHGPAAAHPEHVAARREILPEGAPSLPRQRGEPAPEAAGGRRGPRGVRPRLQGGPHVRRREAEVGCALPGPPAEGPREPRRRGRVPQPADQRREGRLRLGAERDHEAD